MNKFVQSLCLISVLLIQCAFAVPINRDAKAIAKVFPKSNLKGGNAESAGGQVKKMIHAMSKTKRNSRSSLQAIMGKALDFRDDIGPYQKAATSNAILNAWEVAYDSGAIS